LRFVNGKQSMIEYLQWIPIRKLWCVSYSLNPRTVTHFEGKFGTKCSRKVISAAQLLSCCHICRMNTVLKQCKKLKNWKSNKSLISNKSCPWHMFGLLCIREVLICKLTGHKITC
jgi:hypothetical protein